MNNVRRSIILISIGLMMGLAAFALHASDRSIRCGGNLILGGGGKDSSGMYEVLKKMSRSRGEAGKHLDLHTGQYAQDADVQGRWQAAAD